MFYFADLKSKEVDETLPFNLKNIPKEIKDDVKEFQKLYPYPRDIKVFKCKNETGIFEAAVYLNNYYKVVVNAQIISRKYVIMDSRGITIEKTGRVCYYMDDHSRRNGVIKIDTGFILDENVRERMQDFISEMEDFSEHLREKYYKKK